jgi:hypothetical protein
VLDAGGLVAAVVANTAGGLGAQRVGELFGRALGQFLADRGEVNRRNVAVALAWRR